MTACRPEIFPLQGDDTRLFPLTAAFTLQLLPVRRPLGSDLFRLFALFIDVFFIETAAAGPLCAVSLINRSHKLAAAQGYFVITAWWQRVRRGSAGGALT